MVGSYVLTNTLRTNCTVRADLPTPPPAETRQQTRRPVSLEMGGKQAEHTLAPVPNVRRLPMRMRSRFWKRTSHNDHPRFFHFRVPLPLIALWSEMRWPVRAVMGLVMTRLLLAGLCSRPPYAASGSWWAQGVHDTTIALGPKLCLRRSGGGSELVAPRKAEEQADRVVRGFGFPSCVRWKLQMPWHQRGSAVLAGQERMKCKATVAFVLVVKRRQWNVRERESARASGRARRRDMQVRGAARGDGVVSQ